MRGCGGVLSKIALVGMLLALATAPAALRAKPSAAPSSDPAPGCPAGFTNVGILANRRVCQLSGAITGNRVLALLPGVVYSLFGQVDIGIDLGPDPANPRPGGQQGILTIDPGVVVVGSAPTDYLVINRGSQIFAEGTATQPIIFTSRSNLEGGTGPDSVGEWGGIVILGRAPINRCIGSGIPGGSANCEAAVEGMANRFFGGGVPADNTGRLAYLQVRFAGRQISPETKSTGSPSRAWARPPGRATSRSTTASTTASSGLADGSTTSTSWSPARPRISSRSSLATRASSNTCWASSAARQVQES